MNKIRFDEVDFLRAFGIIGVVIVHILTYSLTNPIYKFLWNNLQFVVVSFIFCSGFVLAYFYKDKFTNVSDTLKWYKKRFIRLTVPFWIYLCFHYALWLIFPNFFQGLGLSKSVPYFLKSAFLIGGTNLNWLPLLFLQLTFLFPFFANWMHKKKILFVYLFFSGFITLILTFFQFPYNHYRLIMWVPWSLVLLFAIFLSVKQKTDVKSLITKKRNLFFGVLTFVGFILLYILNLDSGKSLNFYNHKYPPDFFYLLFGVSLTCFFLIIGKMQIFQNNIIKNIYLFISKNSYQIFFIHYILLDLVLTLSKNLVVLRNPLIQFIVIFFPSLFIALVLEKAQKNLKIKHS